MRIIRIIEYKVSGREGKKWLEHTLSNSLLTKFPNLEFSISGCSIRLIDEIIERGEFNGSVTKTDTGNKE